MGCYGNGKISYDPNGFLEDIFFSHLLGPSEQVGTHEKLSWGEQAAGLLARLCIFFFIFFYFIFFFFFFVMFTYTQYY